MTNLFRTSKCLLLGVLALAGGAQYSDYAIAQGSSSSSQQSVSSGDWRQIPKPLLPESTDPQGRAILNQRGQYFDTSAEPGLLEPTPPGIARGGSVSVGLRDEIPFLDDGAIVVGSFNDYQPFLSPVQKKIYTKLELSIEQVIDSGPAHVSQGEKVDLLLSGGTIRLSDGRVISHGLRYEATKYSLQPGHRYVLFLQYHADGDFFTEVKSWDITTGVAMPNAPDDQQRMKKGQSAFAGLPESRFVDAVRLMANQHRQQGAAH